MELENIAGQVTINGAYNGTLDFKNLAKPLQFEGARNTELSVQAVPWPHQHGPGRVQRQRTWWDRCAW